MGPWAFGVPIVLVSCVGLLLNAYILLVVLGLGKQIHQQQTANTLLLIHLGAVEAAVCLVLLIFSTGSWPFAGTWCVLHGFLLALLHPVALWTVTGLNCERYYAIAAPLHYAALVSPRRVIFGLAASWMGSLLLCLPPISGLAPPYKYIPGLGCCAPDFGNDNWGSSAVVYGVAYAFLGLALPAVLVTVCNLRVLGIARYHRHRIASAIYEVTLSAQVTITHQRNPFFIPSITSPNAGGGPPRFHSAASTVMQLVGSLYLLYFPYCGLILWEVCCAIGVGGVGSQQRLHAHPRFASLASLLLACSPPVNGLLYGLKSRTLRRSVQNYWRKKATKSELQQEIQARTPSATGSRRPSGNGQASFFPFPPLQRRLSEALLVLGSCRTGNPFDDSNIRNPFHRSRLQTAASCNTLRVPNAELGGATKPVRTSASTASLQLVSRYCNDFDGSESIENDERRWRQRSTGSDSSTGSSDASVWTTGVMQKQSRGKNGMENWPIGRRFVRVKTLEEGVIFIGNRPLERSESSDNTENTATTTTSTLPRTLPLEKQEFGTKTKKMEDDGDDNSQEGSESDASWSSTEEVNEKKPNIVILEENVDTHHESKVLN